MNEKAKVGILTWHYYSNFGSALQTFATFNTLITLGVDPIVINYRNPRIASINSSFFTKFKRLVKSILAILPYYKEKWTDHPQRFRKLYLKETKLFTTESEGKHICSHLTAVVCGSDQIWAPNVFNPFYFAHFIDSHIIKKISYAASIGLNDIPDHLVTRYCEYLKEFDSISVREQEGKDLLKQKCNLDSYVVLDPTLLVDVDTYRRMQRCVKEVQKPFVFCYFLNKEHSYKESVIQYAKQHNLQIVGVSDNKSDSRWMTTLQGLGADHFLWLINNSETVITDSYHGSIFSLLFHKNLWTFVRFREDSPICQNSRIRQLCNNFNINKRVVTSDTFLDDSIPIDYEYFESKLSVLKEFSFSYLKRSLL